MGMATGEAIKNLTRFSEVGSRDLEPEGWEALKLGIEALKLQRDLLEWFRYSTPMFSTVKELDGSMDLGQCATLIAHIPLGRWHSLRASGIFLGKGGENG